MNSVGERVGGMTNMPQSHSGPQSQPGAESPGAACTNESRI